MQSFTIYNYFNILFIITCQYIDILRTSFKYHLLSQSWFSVHGYSILIYRSRALMLGVYSPCVPRIKGYVIFRTGAGVFRSCLTVLLKSPRYLPITEFPTNEVR